MPSGEKLINLCEDQLKITLPQAYKRFTQTIKTAAIDGFRIIGLPEADGKGDNLISLTGLLREKRPDLPLHYAAIIPVRSAAVCLDLSRSDGADAPLVEISFKSTHAPLDIGQTFSQWFADHSAFERRFRAAWKRLKNRQFEAKGRRLQDWKTAIFRSQDYLVALGAFRYNFRLGCLEVDEFLPISQPHIGKNDSVRLLLSEAWSRARDYSGSLTLQFTRDIREDEFGRIRPRNDWEKAENELSAADRGKLDYWRIPAPVPAAVCQLARQFGIDLPAPETGRLDQTVSVRLWFASLGLPPVAEQRIKELAAAGYARPEIISEIISTGIWPKDEAVWLCLNAPRPEAILLGSDPCGDRFAYSESLYYGRAALLGAKLSYAIMAEMNGELFLEEVESAKTVCTLLPGEGYWLIKANSPFRFPPFWFVNQAPSQDCQADIPWLVMPLPDRPLAESEEIVRLEACLAKVLAINSPEAIQGRALLLSNEFVSPYYCPCPETIRRFAARASELGVSVLAAPSRTDLYLDEELHTRFRQASDRVSFPAREETKTLAVYAIPEDLWQVPATERTSRAIEHAADSALIFARQLAAKRETARYGREFSLMCEVLEREACRLQPPLFRLDGQAARDLAAGLKSLHPELAGLTLPFVRPEQLTTLIAALGDSGLRQKLEAVNSGLIIAAEHWGKTYQPPSSVQTSYGPGTASIEAAVFQQIEQTVDANKQARLYAGNWNEIDRAHLVMRTALENNLPFGIVSLQGKIRSSVFSEMAHEYLWQRTGTTRIDLPIAYADGSQGGPFPLFSLPRLDRPDDHRFFRYHVGLVSLRHSEADAFIDQSLIRNREINSRHRGTEQEDIAFRRTFSFITEFLRLINGDLADEELSLRLRITIGCRPKMKTESWRGLNLHLFHTTGLEAAGIGAYRAVIEAIRQYRGQIIVTPRILVPAGKYKTSLEWY